MNLHNFSGHAESNPEVMETGDLVKEALSDAVLLAQRQIKLAQLEAMQQIRGAKPMVELVGAAGIAAICAFNLLLVAAAFAIGSLLGGRDWAGALIVAAAMLLVATILGITGWNKRVKTILPATRGEINQELQWVKTQLT